MNQPEMGSRSRDRWRRPLGCRSGAIWIGWAVALAFFIVPVSTRAQQAPHIGYAYPAGGKQGATVEVKVGGQYIQGTAGAYFSGRGVSATVESVWRPLNPREVQELSQKIQDARKKLNLQESRPGAMLRIAQEAGLTEQQIRDLQEFRKNRQDPKRQLNPQIEEIVTLQVKIDPEAAPGVRDMRLLTPAGLTSPLRFVVGTLNEATETETTTGDGAPQSVGSLPIVLNGQILPGEVDRYAFSAKRGERIVAVGNARELMPYLADAVPGWFQIALGLRDAKGEEIAYADHYLFDPTPVLSCVIPADGVYTLEVHDAIYRGREDFVYRVTLGQIPYVTSIFPLGGVTGRPATVKLTGWNLPASQTTLAAVAQPEIEKVSCGVSNESSFKVDSLPDIAEREPNDSIAKAQNVALPTVIQGRIDKPGDQDVFRFKGRAGQRIFAEVFARRLGSCLDSVLELTDAKGKRIVVNDDFDDQGFGLLTYQSDSYLTATLPSSGAYYLRLRDATGKGGPDYAYRLRVSQPRPDFELRTIPSSITLRAGTTSAFTVYALRRDGYEGRIDLSLRDSQNAFSLSGGVIPARADHVRLTLTGPSGPTDAPVSIQVMGTAGIGGVNVSHLSVPADDMMQAFAYRHLVPANEELVAVIGRPNRGIPWLAQNVPVNLSLSNPTQIRLGGPNGPLASRIHLVLEDAPDGFSLEGVKTGPDGFVATVRLDPKKVKPGTAGNLILSASTEQQVTPPKGGPAKTRRISLGYVPAIPFAVVAGS